MSTVTPNAPRTEPSASSSTALPQTPRRQAGGFWSFLKTLFVGTAGLAVLGVAGALAGSAWLTANQRAEAEKPQPWTDPSFTTTAVTTGGLIARWMDNDGNLENGHTYIKGIYEVWKPQHVSAWLAISLGPERQSALPQLWQLEFNKDAVARNQSIRLEAERIKNEYDREVIATKKSNYDETARLFGAKPK